MPLFAAGRIHISHSTKLALDENDAFDIEDRGLITIKVDFLMQLLYTISALFCSLFAFSLYDR